MATQTGKQRAARVPLDYFKGWGWLQRGKLAASAAALLIFGGWCAFDCLRGEAGRLSYSRGPVAASHATWETRCEACHEPFAPIAGDAWAAPYAAEYAGASWSSTGRCEECHAGAAHHARQDAAPTCARCHRDHRGRDADLTRVPDSACVNCHAHLAAHVKEGGSGPRHEDVRRFERGSHPEFDAVAARPGEQAVDAGKLKFNHKLHLAPGIVSAPDAAPFTYLQIRDGKLRERYRSEAGGGEAAEAAPVRLGCASCHRLDAAPPGETLSTSQALATPGSAGRAPGATMLPVSFERDCRACHPLSFDPASPEEVVPHHEQPPAVRRFLENTYAAQILSRSPRLLETPVIRRPAPGPVPGEEAAAARDELARKVAAAEWILYAGKQTCGECHEYEGAEAGVAPEASASPVPAAIVPPAVPAVWFPHAIFRHTAHRALACEACHAGARESQAGTDVLLPGIDTCLRCHAPGAGARSDCAECHRYHGGDQPLHGPGAPGRDGRREFEIPAFLSGPSKADKG